MYVAWQQERDGWTKEDIDFALKGKKNVYARAGGRALPLELGDGMAARISSGLPGQPYEITAKFRCGKKDRLLTFSFGEFVAGRDAIQDMMEFMRVAQTRYAAVNECDLEV